MSEPMGKELARLVYEELIIEFPGYKSLPEPMAKALIRLGVNNGIRFSTSSTDKLQEQLNNMKKALTEIAELSDPLDNDTLMSVVANIAGAALEGGEDEL